MSKKKPNKNKRNTDTMVSNSNEITSEQESETKVSNKDDTKENVLEKTEDTVNEEKAEQTVSETKTEPEQNEKKDEQGEEIASEKSREEKPLLPRKRKIVKNNQLPITIGIVVAILLALFVWKAFFNNSLTGQWFYVHDGQYTETLDNPIETGDSIENINKYSQRVVYEFTDDGKCSVTLGTMSVMGGYSTYQTENGSILSANVYYQYMPLLYGSYKYDLSGNMFTGRKLTIFGNNDDSNILLKQGEGHNPLKRYDDEKLDDRLTGKWKDPDYEQYYTFTKDGHFIMEIEGHLRIDHVYTVFDEGILKTKYYADTEQTYTYNYSFDDGELTFNGIKLIKVE